MCVCVGGLGLGPSRVLMANEADIAMNDQSGLPAATGTH